MFLRNNAFFFFFFTFARKENDSWPLCNRPRSRWNLWRTMETGNVQVRTSCNTMASVRVKKKRNNKNSKIIKIIKLSIKDICI